MKRVIAVVSLALGLLAGGLLGTGTVDIRAQDATNACATPVPEPDTSNQKLLGRADYTTLPDSPARMTTTQIELAPGGATQPFASSGPMLVMVIEGTVSLTADQARIGDPPEPSLGGISVEAQQPAAEPAQGVAVTKGEQISLDGGVTAKFSNDTNASVRLILVTLAPATEATPTP
jgi:hypothetical protein